MFLVTEVDLHIALVPLRLSAEFICKSPCEAMLKSRNVIG